MSSEAARKGLMFVVSAPSGNTLRENPPASGGTCAMAAPWTPGSAAAFSTTWSKKTCPRIGV